MARIDDLVKEVPSKELQASLAEELAELRKRVPFGLVYERHLPEFAVSADQEILPGAYATPRDDHGRRLSVLEVAEGKATVVENGADDPVEVPVEELLAVRGLSEKIFPGLTSLERVERAPEKPWHAVIKGENYHALQLLEFMYAGQVDCIYIDPPYNTGDRNWVYNNRYVDSNDAWRHSKWLSFMEKRLRIAKRLLKQDGVLIVTVDEHEVSHLGVLLEQILPEAVRQMITIVINPKGVTEERFSRVEEYAYFCFLGDAGVAGLRDDLLAPLTKEETEKGGQPRWKGLLRSGTNARRKDRENLFFPVLIDTENGAVAGAGEPLPLDQPPDFDSHIDGQAPAWPIRRDGSLGNWGVGHITLRELIQKGYVRMGGYDPERKTWALSYLSKRHREQIDAGVLEIVGHDKIKNVVEVQYGDPEARRVKRVWHRSSHDAGAGGSDLVRAFVGERLFSFPKSLYAVRDALAAVTSANPSALIVDFFAGSGTTLHATALLNERDGGCRRCILVTNNEVDGETASEFHKAGHFAGDEEFEARGVFESVTRPRCKAALTGRRPDGKRVKGKYLDGRPYDEGFEENCEFFQLDYLGHSDVEFGMEFERLLPVLWLMAGGVGPRHGLEEGSFSVEAGSPYALYSKARDLRPARERLAEQDGVDRFFFVTDSEDAYAEWCERFGAPGRRMHMVPQDYLTFFRRYRASRG